MTKMTRNLYGLTAIAGFALTSASASAAEIAQYSFTGTGTKANPTYLNGFDAYVAAGDWVLGPGNTEFYVTGGTVRVRSLTTGTTTSPQATDYFEFTITASGVSAGLFLDVASISGIYGKSGAITGKMGLYVDQDNDGYDAGDQLGSDVTAADGGAAITPIPVGIQLADGESATFRFYFGDDANKAGRLHFLDDITINGSIVPAPGTYAPFVLPVDPAVNLIANGGFSEVTDTNGDPLTSGGYNIEGTFGDFEAYWGAVAEVTGWAPYYDDPEDLTTHIGIKHADDSGVPILDGTFYLDTLVQAGSGNVTLNSSMDYRNGLMQADILNGVTVKAGATYQLSVNAYQPNSKTDQSSATFTAALTDNSTDVAAAIGSSIAIDADTPADRWRQLPDGNDQRCRYAGRRRSGPCDL